MSLANWSLLTAAAASAILSAWLFYKYKLAAAKLNGALRELAEVTRRRAELAAQVIHLESSIARQQEAARKQYEAIAKSIEESVTPGTPGSTDSTIAKLREAFKANVHRADSNPVLPAAPAKPKG